MALPDVNLTILDGALGLAAEAGERTQVKLGTSSAGTVNTLYSISSIGDLVSRFGQGPLVEAAARVLAIAGGPVYCMRVTGSVAGAAGAVNKTGTGTATLALTGSVPYDAYELSVVIVKGGASLAAATATFQWSLDGGRTYSAETAIPVSGVYQIPNSGITLNWTYTSGTGFVAADTWTATCTGPGYTTTDLANAMTALLADPRTWFLVHVVGPTADLAGARALFAALGTHMATAATGYRFARALMEAPDGQTDAQLLANSTGFGDLADARVAVGGRYLQAVSPISYRLYRRNVAWEAAARASAVSPSVDLGQVDLGPLTGVPDLVSDEQATPGLDAGRFITCRSIINRPGKYITRGRLMAAAGSDFAWLANGRVIDIASSVARDRALKFLNARVKTNPNGTIQDAAAKAIETFINRGIREALVDKGDATDVAVAVDRTINILSTGQLKVRVRVQPFGYASAIEVELGFRSPSAAAAA